MCFCISAPVGENYWQSASVSVHPLVKTTGRVLLYQCTRWWKLLAECFCISAPVGENYWQSASVSVHPLVRTTGRVLLYQCTRWWELLAECFCISAPVGENYWQSASVSVHPLVRTTGRVLLYQCTRWWELLAECFCISAPYGENYWQRLESSDFMALYKLIFIVEILDLYMCWPPLVNSDKTTLKFLSYSGMFITVFFSGAGVYCGRIDVSGSAGPQSVTVDTKLIQYLFIMSHLQCY